MKTILAYTLLVLCVPNFAGLLASSVIQVPVAWITPRSKVRTRAKSLGWQILEVVGGFVAVLVAVSIFKALSARVSLAIPVVIEAWTTLHCITFRQPRLERMSWLPGVLAAWLALAPAR